MSARVRKVKVTLDAEELAAVQRFANMEHSGSLNRAAQRLIRMGLRISGVVPVTLTDIMKEIDPTWSGKMPVFQDPIAVPPGSIEKILARRDEMHGIEVADYSGGKPTE